MLCFTLFHSCIRHLTLNAYVCYIRRGCLYFEDVLAIFLHTTPQEESSQVSLHIFLKYCLHRTSHKKAHIRVLSNISRDTSSQNNVYSCHNESVPQRSVFMTILSMWREKRSKIDVSIWAITASHFSIIGSEAKQAASVSGSPEALVWDWWKNNARMDGLFTYFFYMFLYFYNIFWKLKLFI